LAKTKIKKRILNQEVFLLRVS